MKNLFVVVQSYRNWDEVGDTPIMATENAGYAQRICERLNKIRTAKEMKAVYPKGPSTRSELDSTTFELIEVPDTLDIPGIEIP